MNRREFLQCAALLAAGTSVIPSSWALNEEQKVFLTSQPNYIDRHPLAFFNTSQRAAITAIAEQIIPATDTPGAIDAGAPRFIELMTADWFTDAERKFFMDGLEQLQQRAGGSFADLSDTDQLVLLEQLEEEAGESSWFDLGNVTRVWVDKAPFICQIKELTVLGFMLSEVGSTQFLRQNPMGSFDGDVPLGPNDSAYAADMPIRLIAGSSL